MESLHAEMLRLESESLPAAIHQDHWPSARNLLHYIALRRHDIREMQQELADLGFSSLGRTESHVLRTIHSVLRSLSQLAGFDADLPDGRGPDRLEGKRILERNTEAVLGPPPQGRSVRIMVTMPSEAAEDYHLVRTLLATGMNCMRINCAHDGPPQWAAMIANLRQAEQELGLACKVEMDLAGPKLRTGPVTPGPSVVKCRPKRDAFGRVTQPARVWLTSIEAPSAAPAPADAALRAPEAFLSALGAGCRIRFVDTRGARRGMTIRELSRGGLWAVMDRTAYFAPGVTLTSRGLDGRPVHGEVGPLPARPQTILLKPGDTLVLVRELEPGQPASPGGDGVPPKPARISVTLPEFFDCVEPGQPIWFDDGAIGGTVASVSPGEVTVTIEHALPQGQKLGAEKGINVPGAALRVSALSEEDRENLKFAARHADIIGLSFVRSAADVHDVRAALAELGREDLGLMLKIETREGFENLPELLLEAMRGPAAAVMIARGDLAVECGYERLAELQEEILWIAEAAHVPVVWATQVLESLAKTGKPSRSEITDAAMGERADCVMLNKGPFVTDAVRVLRDILVRMQGHQEKKTPMLRKLQVAAAFGTADRPGAAGAGKRGRQARSGAPRDGGAEVQSSRPALATTVPGAGSSRAATMSKASSDSHASFENR